MVSTAPLKAAPSAIAICGVSILPLAFAVLPRWAILLAMIRPLNSPLISNRRDPQISLYRGPGSDHDPVLG